MKPAITAASASRPNDCARPHAGALVMHPGPMNRDVEIASAVADGPQSVIQQQVANGVAVRMAVLTTIASNVAAEGGHR